MIYVVSGMPGSGKTTWVNRVAGVTVRLPQSAQTRRLDDAIKLVAGHIARGHNVALESWDWWFPDQAYPVERVYFQNQPSRCLGNVIWDGIHARYWFSAIRLDALIENYERYCPPPESLPVFQHHVTARDVTAFMVLYPNRHEATIMKLLSL
jgi:adenylate kinase family enzyme